MIHGSCYEQFYLQTFSFWEARISKYLKTISAFWPPIWKCGVRIFSAQSVFIVTMTGRLRGQRDRRRRRGQLAVEHKAAGRLQVPQVGIYTTNNSQLCVPEALRAFKGQSFVNVNLNLLNVNVLKFTVLVCILSCKSGSRNEFVVVTIPKSNFFPTDLCFFLRFFFINLRRVS